jgi:hypothetical protein
MRQKLAAEIEFESYRFDSFGLESKTVGNWPSLFDRLDFVKQPRAGVGPVIFGGAG